MCESLRTFPVGQPFVNPGLTSGLWNFTFHKCSSQGCCRNLTHNKCSFDTAFLKYLWQLQQVTQLLKCLGEKITQGPMRLIHKALQRPHCARSVHWFRTHPLRVFVETSKALSPLRKHIISNKKIQKFRTWNLVSFLQALGPRIWRPSETNIRSGCILETLIQTPTEKNG